PSPPPPFPQNFNHPHGVLHGERVAVLGGGVQKGARVADGPPVRAGWSADAADVHPEEKRKALSLLRALLGKAAFGRRDLRSHTDEHRSVARLGNRNGRAGTGAQGIAGTRDDHWRMAGWNGSAGAAGNGRADRARGHASDERGVGQPVPYRAEPNHAIAH
ncbi:MAG: hypothetical protein NTY92_02580, partial [Nitrosospira sp.]|nr:hypothetical protein [Nitrosospira sp.]